MDKEKNCKYRFFTKWMKKSMARILDNKSGEKIANQNIDD